MPELILVLLPTTSTASTELGSIHRGPTGVHGWDPGRARCWLAASETEALSPWPLIRDAKRLKGCFGTGLGSGYFRNPVVEGGRCCLIVLTTSRHSGSFWVSRFHSESSCRPMRTGSTLRRCLGGRPPFFTQFKSRQQQAIGACHPPLRALRSSFGLLDTIFFFAQTADTGIEQEGVIRPSLII